MTSWIKVEEEKPEYYKLVLCYWNNSFAVCWRASDGDNDIYTIAGTDNVILKITHWTHLPEQPTETICSICGDSGYTIDVEAECCGNYKSYGCCGVPNPVQVQVQCNCSNSPNSSIPQTDDKLSF